MEEKTLWKCPDCTKEFQRTDEFFHKTPTYYKKDGLRGETVVAKNHQKTHCSHGHPYSKENTHIKPSGGRVCMECNRIQARNHRAKAKLQINK